MRYVKKSFLGHSISCMRNVKVARKWVGTILSDGIKYFFSLVCVSFDGLSWGP
jgi:hypothetical protein